MLVYRIDTVRALREDYPFEPEVAGCHFDITFVADAAVQAELSALAIDIGADEKIAPGDGVIYWRVSNGDALDNTVGKTPGNKRYRTSITTRNLRTLSKVLR